MHVFMRWWSYISTRSLSTFPFGSATGKVLTAQECLTSITGSLNMFPCDGGISITDSLSMFPCDSGVTLVPEAQEA